MTLEELAKIAPVSQFVTPVLVILSVGIGYLAFQTAKEAIRENVRINKRNKRADAIIHCNMRYDTLYDLRISIPGKKPEEQEPAVKSYFARYWGLKSDEFDYWLAGLVDIETFCNWTYLMLKAFRSDTAVGSESNKVGFVSAWETIGRPDHDITNAWFYQFTEAIFEVAQFCRGKDVSLDKVHAEITDIVRILLEKSAEYREQLQNDMTLEQYLRSREVHNELGLKMKDRASKLLATEA